MKTETVSSKIEMPPGQTRLVGVSIAPGIEALVEEDPTALDGGPFFSPTLVYCQ